MVQQVVKMYKEFLQQILSTISMTLSTFLIICLDTFFSLFAVYFYGEFTWCCKQHHIIQQFNYSAAMDVAVIIQQQTTCCECLSTYHLLLQAIVFPVPYETFFGTPVQGCHSKCPRKE